MVQGQSNFHPKALTCLDFSSCVEIRTIFPYFRELAQSLQCPMPCSEVYPSQAGNAVKGAASVIQNNEAPVPQMPLRTASCRGLPHAERSQG